MSSEISDALESEGIAEAFPIQALALPIALAGHDMIGQARTGTGKTLAFGVPLLQRIEHGGRVPQALVVVPTRELAIQVTDDLRIAGGKLGSRVLSVYGGRAYEPQIAALKEGVEVIVGTPGRLLDLVKQRYVDLSQVKVLVLDEADRMLDLGFLPDIERIISLVPDKRQTMLFSATMPGEIVTLSRRYLTQPTNVRAESHAESETTPQTVQHVWQAHQMDKPEVLARILQARDRGLTMVFCQTKRACDRVAEDLAKRGFAAAAVHGDLGQSQRERALRAFRAGKIDVLVATDVAARGLDVDDITHVINYECPEDDKAYVHRIGRTGRAGKEGISVTFVDWRDLQRWKLINTALGLEFPEPVEMYSTSEALYAAMNIPSDVTGTLPKERQGRAGLAAEELEDIGETGRQRSQSGDRDRDRDRDRKRGRSERGDQNRHAEQSKPAEQSERTEQSDPEESPQPRRRKTRSRARTRAGQTVDAVAAAAAPADTVTEPATGPADSTDSTSTAAPSRPELPGTEQAGAGQADAGQADAGQPSTEPARPKRSRSRRRGTGRSAESSSAPADGGTEAPAAAAPAAPAPAAIVAEPKDTALEREATGTEPATAERTRARRRTRGSRPSAGASENS